MRIYKNILSQGTNHNGFTLVEIIAVLTILAILASLSIPRFIDLSANASQKVLKTVVTELNSREKLVWAQIKTSQIGWIDDETLFSQIDTNLGTDYKWSPKAEIDGGILHFKDLMIKLQRISSTATSAGRWEIISSSN
jgi:prepilin-type N-terminal cleavage/methylation domain-containing protein